MDMGNHWIYEKFYEKSWGASLGQGEVRELEDDGVDGLVQERRNSSALAMELCLSCTNIDG